MPTISINEHLDERLDVFLSKQIDLTRSQIQKLIKQGTITVNGEPTKTKALLEVGDKIFYPEPTNPTEIKKDEPPELDILFEDNDLLVINKPAGLLVHEAFENEYRTTVVDALLKRHPEIAEIGDDPKRPGIVHRLDKDVSGLMIIAKTQDAFEYLKDQFKNRRVKKEYLALVYGEMPKDADTINLKISRSKQKGRMVARTGSQEGKEAVTQYDVLERYATATYLTVRILTGRTHQIRVHLQSQGYPIVGDKLYKIKNLKMNEIPLDRLFLHAHRLGIELMDGTEKLFVSPLPDELQDLLNTLPTV